ncbi:MAG: hypothetical protein QOE36_937, partial [Gaiellaceae bacterium]|nr:hypothetical protein [Gaiellaceae bacterium]
AGAQERHSRVPAQGSRRPLRSRAWRDAAASVRQGRPSAGVDGAWPGSAAWVQPAPVRRPSQGAPGKAPSRAVPPSGSSEPAGPRARRERRAGSERPGRDRAAAAAPAGRVPPRLRRAPGSERTAPRARVPAAGAATRSRRAARPGPRAGRRARSPSRESPPAGAAQHATPALPAPKNGPGGAVARGCARATPRSATSHRRGACHGGPAWRSASIAASNSSSTSSR